MKRILTMVDMYISYLNINYCGILLGFFPVFNPCVFLFRLLKTFADDERKYFKSPVKNVPFHRYLTVHAN